MRHGRGSPDYADLLESERSRQRREALDAARDRESDRRRSEPRITTSPICIPMVDDWNLPTVLDEAPGVSPAGMGTSSPDIIAAAMRGSLSSPAIGVSSGISPARSVSLPRARRSATTTATTTTSRRTTAGKRPRTATKRPRRTSPPPTPTSLLVSGSPSTPQRPPRTNGEMRRQLEQLQQQELEPADDEEIRNIARTSTITTVYDKKRPPRVQRISTRTGPGRRTRRVTTLLWCAEAAEDVSSTRKDSGGENAGSKSEEEDFGLVEC